MPTSTERRDPHGTRIQGSPAEARSSALGAHATKTRGTLGARLVQRSSIDPRKEDSRPSQGGNGSGGGYEIRTREAVTPTRFPSVRHRPLGEFSNYATLPGVYPLSAT